MVYVLEERERESWGGERRIFCDMRTAHFYSPRYVGESGATDANCKFEWSKRNRLQLASIFMVLVLNKRRFKSILESY